MKEEDDGIFFFSNKKKKKLQRKEGAYLFSLAFAFGMKHSSCVTTLALGL
jgi:hypothetical protein